MDEFKPITTQEELDAVIRSRLERERNKFADYDTLKTSNADLQKALDKARADAQTAAQASAQKIAELEKQNKDYATAAVKTRIAAEFGIPDDIKDRLCGDTEEDIKKDAERLAPLFANRRQPPPPLRSTEGEGINSADASWKQMSDKLKET